MIQRIEHSTSINAREIRRVFQISYSIEAQLLGAKKFPHSPSYQLDRGIFENFLAKRCQELGVSFIDGTKVLEVAIKNGTKNNYVTAQHLETNVKRVCIKVVRESSKGK